MFEFLKKLFHNAPDAADPETTEAAPPQPAANTAQGTQIHYDPELVPHLIADHQRLVKLFGGIVAAAQARDERRLVPLLGDFGAAVRDHLLSENVRFYVYVQHNGSTEQRALVHGFQHEMREIGRVLTDFLFRHSKQEEWDDTAWVRFDHELGEIGQVLTRRIATEENTLYPLYRPPV